MSWNDQCLLLWSSSLLFASNTHLQILCHQCFVFCSRGWLSSTHHQLFVAPPSLGAYAVRQGGDDSCRSGWVLARLCAAPRSYWQHVVEGAWLGSPEKTNVQEGGGVRGIVVWSYLSEQVLRVENWRWETGLLDSLLGVKTDRDQHHFWFHCQNQNTQTGRECLSVWTDGSC